MTPDHDTLRMSPQRLHELAEECGGVPITGVVPGSPSERAGLRYGDVLLRLNGRDTPNLTAFFEARDADKTRMDVVVLRAGRIIEARLSLDRAGEAAWKRTVN